VPSFAAAELPLPHRRPSGITLSAKGLVNVAMFADCVRPVIGGGETA
jgi:hypothetical protein